MSETFRNVRTNLQFILENGKNVILVTSTISGEGKSFVSSNLAISLSLLGKKVVIVGLDIRKPGLNKVFNLSRKEHGITQFLTNPTVDLMDLVQPSDINKNLFILPGVGYHTHGGRIQYHIVKTNLQCFDGFFQTVTGQQFRWIRRNCSTRKNKQILVDRSYC